MWITQLKHYFFSLEVLNLFNQLEIYNESIVINVKKFFKIYQFLYEVNISTLSECDNKGNFCYNTYNTYYTYNEIYLHSSSRSE